MLDVLDVLDLTAGRMRCPAIEGIETRRKYSTTSRGSSFGRMRCPAIEGIETRPASTSPAGTVSGRMRCPAIEGIETRGGTSAFTTIVPRRMRCPAIEGIETFDCVGDLDDPLLVVECVAPLLRGLKPVSQAIRRLP